MPNVFLSLFSGHTKEEINDNLMVITMKGGVPDWNIPNIGIITWTRQIQQFQLWCPFSALGYKPNACPTFG